MQLAQSLDVVALGQGCQYREVGITLDARQESLRARIVEEWVYKEGLASLAQGGEQRRE